MESDEPYVILSWKQDLCGLKFEDRNRLEYRHSRFADDNIRYRNKFSLKISVRIQRHENSAIQLK